MGEGGEGCGGDDHRSVPEEGHVQGCGFAREPKMNSAAVCNILRTRSSHTGGRWWPLAQLVCVLFLLRTGWGRLASSPQDGYGLLSMDASSSATFCPSVGGCGITEIGFGP